MYISKRILFFKSKQNGYLLFSGNSNSLFQISEENVQKIKDMIQYNNISFLPNDMKQMFLKTGIILPESDEEFLCRMKYNSISLRFQKQFLSLTIAPTMACNFKCSYCYEGERINNNFMNETVIEGIIKYIEKASCKKNDIIWYGGEPLLAFDKIRYFNDLIKQKKLKCSQAIITNGSLLTEEKLQFFLDNKFNYIQITLDGNELLHNEKRPMKNGANSFQTIINNLDKCYSYLCKTNQNIKIVIRINVDNRNSKCYKELTDFLTKRYENRISYYPAFIIKSSESICKHENCMSELDETNFILSLAKENKLITPEIYPLRNKLFHCSAQCSNYYLIDPYGDLYKCAEDIGIKKYSVGNILTGFTDPNNINYNYILNSTGFEDNECKDCLFLFSCMGGCAKRRKINKKMNKIINPVCVAIKNDPEGFIENYFSFKNNCVAVKK